MTATPLFDFDNVSDFITADIVTDLAATRECKSISPCYFISDDSSETGCIGGKFRHRYVALKPEVREVIQGRMSKGEIGGLKCIYWPKQDVTSWWANDTSYIASALIATTPGCHPWARNKNGKFQ